MLTDELCARLRAARDFRPQRYLRMAMGEKSIGWVRRAEIGRLGAWPDVFGFSAEKISVGEFPEKNLSKIRSEERRVGKECRL